MVNLLENLSRRFRLAEWPAAGWLVALAAGLATAAGMARGVSCGHDFDFHLVSWMEASRAWHEGVAYPRWAESPNWGAGEPRFVFYPPLTWLAGALLGTFVGWSWTPVALTFLILLGTGLATRRLAGEFLDEPTATLAGTLATVAPYALFTVFERSALAELAAGVWIPLLLLFALRGAASARRQDGFAAGLAMAAPLAFTVAACWLTNAPAGVMASYLVALAALVAAVSERAWWPVARAVVGVVLGLGLAAFYLVPAAWEQRWVAINQATDVGMRVEDSWLFARHAAGAGIPDMAFHDAVLWRASWLVVATILLAAAGLWVALRRSRLDQGNRVFWLPLAVLLPVVLLMQFRYSLPVWDVLPKMRFLQFPWRLTLLLGAPWAVFCAAALPGRNQRGRGFSIVVYTLLFAVSLGVAARFFHQDCDDEDAVVAQRTVFLAGTGVAGTDEYAVRGSGNALVATGLPEGCLVSDPLRPLGVAARGEADGESPEWTPEQHSCEAVARARLWQDEHKQLSFDADRDGFLVLRLRWYPAWRVTVNQAAVEAVAQREDGLLVVPVKAGANVVDVRWSATADVMWGRWITLLALGLTGWIGWRERRLRRRRKISMSGAQIA
uniref:Membrane protein 6-pyruvoyl-tetrahydropterin synthase-related domain-containing protein n=1 Tax=mine drainage metagenome TaxID=410659 RepID=E6QIN3_9ZZZZ